MTATRTPIRIEDVSKRFDATVTLDRITLHVQAGEMFFLLGPSGCGKTTLLRILAGFVQPDSGDVFFGDECITQTPPRLRGAGMVFQTYALWPHLSVNRNVGYGLEVRGVGREEMAKRIDKALKMVRMDGFGERRPAQLSGGQQQRVALARALVIEPRVVLLDEPLSNLDARLRDEMREEIRRLHNETGLTMVYVTHDQKEALGLADRLAVMERGKLVQVGPPLEVYQRPVSRFVAGFLGDANFIPGTVRGFDEKTCTLDTPLGTLIGQPTAAMPAIGSSVIACIRPHAFTLQGTGPENRVEAVIDQAAFLGETLHIHVHAGATPLLVTSLPHVAGQLRPGEKVTLTAAPEQVVVLPA